MKKLRLGKKTARKGAVRFQLDTYVDLTKLPAPPEEFGHGDALQDYGMLKNDWCGDCVIAGAAHETIVWRKEAHLYYAFDDKCAVGDYSALTGFDPSQTDANGNNPTDQGTDMQQAAEYRRTVGIVDSLGWRHRIVAYMALQPGNVAQLVAATYLFDAVGVGIRFPASAQAQFEQGIPWSVVPGDPIEGGHYVPCVGRRNGLLDVITWGALHQMSPEFYQANCDEVVAYLTIENLISGRTPEGFDLAQLQADLAALKPVPISSTLAAPTKSIWPWCKDDDDMDDLVKAIKDQTKAISGLTSSIGALAQRIDKKPLALLLQFGQDVPIK